MAQSMIFAGLRETFIDIHGTSLPWNTESPEVRSLIVSVTERLNANTAQCAKHIMFHIHITFPARGTLAGVAFRIRRFLANSWVLTWIRGTRSNHYLAVHTWSAEREKKKKKENILLRARCFSEEWKRIATCMIILHSSRQHFHFWKM